MRTKQFISIVLFSLFLIGCSDDVFDDEVLGVQDFYVLGTNDNKPGDLAEIDPYVNRGMFDVFAKLSKPDLGFYINLYVNNQESLRNATQLFALECTNDDDFCYEPDYFSVGCWIESDLSGECGDQTFEVLDIFNQLPFSGYILVELCHRVQNRCVVEAEQVLFR